MNARFGPWSSAIADGVSLSAFWKARLHRLSALKKHNPRHCAGLLAIAALVLSVPMLSGSAASPTATLTASLAVVLQDKTGTTKQKKPAVTSKVAWGKPVRGLRVGIAFVGKKRAFWPSSFPGDRMAFQIRLQNLTDKDITIRYEQTDLPDKNPFPPGAGSWLWTARTTNQERISIFPLAYLSRQRKTKPRKLTIPAKSQVVLPGPQPKFRIAPSFGSTAYSEPTVFTSREGKYTVSAAPLFADPDDKSSIWLNKLSTGSLKVTISLPFSSSTTLLHPLNSKR